ncbi:MAG: DNA gyrase inhibitor YacG [Bryobacteraceae bacterium]
MKCSICKKEISPESPEFPFCSERCRIIDLGNWASGKYRIPSSERSRDPKEEPGHEDED